MWRDYCGMKLLDQEVACNRWSESSQLRVPEILTPTFPEINSWRLPATSNG
jgi:hypothetical protein